MGAFENAAELVAAFLSQPPVRVAAAERVVFRDAMAEKVQFHAFIIVRGSSGKL